MSVHLEQFSSLDQVEQRLNELDLDRRGDRGDLARRLVYINIAADTEGWYAVLAWRD